MPQLIGPFTQIITLNGLSLKGSLTDDQLEVIGQGGVVVEGGVIVEVGEFKRLSRDYAEIQHIKESMVLIPGLVDAHTHLVWGGSRAKDYTMRMGGATYQEILSQGGGIFDTVAKTQSADPHTLQDDLIRRAERHLADGVTTIEVKSGYGLVKDQELKILQTIKEAKSQVTPDLIPTCLAAHVCPKDFKTKEFLDYLSNELLPEIRVKGLAKRIDIFVEENAFPSDIARPYLEAAKKLGFDLTIHADQFTTGGSQLAVDMGALSADHLEASGEKEIRAIVQSDVVAVALPGASLGLGMQFTPARKLLDAGASLAIATDWNPGSAPMGDLLVQASLIGIYEHLSSAELLSAITFRAAGALNLKDRGKIQEGLKADFIGFATDDYREIFYQQGKLKPTKVWKDGKQQ